MNKGLIGERIYDRRTANNLTQEELAEKLQIAKSTISRWERGEICPSKKHLIRLTHYLKTSLDYLVGDSDSPRVPFSPSDLPEIDFPLSKKDQKIIGMLLELSPSDKEVVYKIIELLFNNRHK